MWNLIGVGRVWPSRKPVLWLCICLAAILCPVGRAAAEKRVALVIGNAAYKETTPLTNTRNDATDMIAVLKRLDFDVLDGLDLDKRGMERLIRQFEQKLAGAEMALFFYAGHGIQVSGQNHLVPVDARLAGEGDLDFESLPLSLVLSRMERTVKTSLVLLDACRDNPLARNLARTMGTRAANVGQGLAEVKTGIGTLISFSTQPGNVALDGTGRNSPYTTALLKEIETPGRDVLTTFAAVRGAVVKATNGKQVPWEHTSLLGSVVLKALEATVSPASPSPPPSTSYAAEAWPLVKDTTNIAELEAYVRRFGDTFHGDLAKQRLETLKRQQQAVLAKIEASKPPEPAPQPKAAPAPKPQQQVAATPPKREACDTVRTVDSEGRESCLVAGRGDAFKDCPECPELVVVPAGSYMMGSPANEPQRDAEEGPQRRVTIDKPFAVGRFEVTVAEFAVCIKAAACNRPVWLDSGLLHKIQTKLKKTKDDYLQTLGDALFEPRNPIVGVSWHDVQAYVTWLSSQTGKTYRMLTEAEWEYAARAQSNFRYSWGNNVGQGNANCKDCGSRWGGMRPAPVGSFKPNAFGIYDMHGNVAEWVQDNFRFLDVSDSDGSAAAAFLKSFRVVRGGSWRDSRGNVRSSSRIREQVSDHDDNIGFRVACTIGSPL